MVEIPQTLISKLKALGPHFVRVAKQGKEPIDKGWTLNPMRADDPGLQEWLREGGNYGVVGGFGLTIVDVDLDELKVIVKEKLPRTFTVQSPGSKGWHLYFISSLEKPIRLRDKEGENIGDIQGQGKMVVGPGSVHPNGGLYHIVDDQPLAQVTREQLLEVFKDFVVPDREIDQVEATARMETKESKIDLDILQVVPLAGLHARGNEYFGSHPIHGSKGGQNFWVNPSKNVWHCFRHGSGGGPLLWFAVEKGIIDCSEATSGALRGNIFKKVLDKAREEGLIKSSMEKADLKDAIEVGDGVTITPLTSEYTPIHPSIGVVDATAFIGVWFPCKVTYPSRKKGQDPQTKIKDTLFLVTDRKERILANDEVLRGHGWKLAYKPVRLKESWPLKRVQEYLNGHQSDPAYVFNQILNDWRVYIEFSDDREYILHALWDMGTYFHVLFHAFPYLYIGGIKRSGKSKALTLHSCLALNAFFSNNMSTSSIYRLIQNAHGTLLIDETEKLTNPDRALEFRSILLSGYKRGAVVYRIEKTKTEMLVPEAFEIYSPKTLANIRGLEDVMDDRCIPTIMKRGKNRKITDREIEIESEHWSELHWGDIKAIYTQICELSELTELVNFLRIPQKISEMNLLTARELELWKPIFAIAKYFDDVLSMFTNSLSSLCSQMMSLALEKAKQKQVENITETGEVILAQILCSLVTTNDYYKIKDIRYEMAEQFDEEQKWLNTRWVGNALRRLGFTDKRRVGTGYEYKLTPESVLDLVERLGIELESKPKEPAKVATPPRLPDLRIRLMETVISKSWEPGYADKDEVVASLASEGFNRGEIEQMITLFIREGTFYEPRRGWLRKT